jgi:hypothetical protein
MNRNLLVPIGVSLLLTVTACSHKKDDKKKSDDATQASYTMPVTEAGLAKTTENWPEASKSAISTLHTKYGLPSAVTEDMVVWSSTAPFKRTVVFKEEVNHQFPIQHSDVLMQTVDYRVPLDKVTALSKFDGSLLVDRTKGELSSKNDKEEMNILSLNLADKIVRGEMTVEQARREYTKNAEAFSAGTSGQLLTGLTFNTQGNTSDPDSMMQSQTENQPEVKKTMQTKKVHEEVIESSED